MTENFKPRSTPQDTQHTTLTMSATAAAAPAAAAPAAAAADAVQSKPVQYQYKSEKDEGKEPTCNVFRTDVVGSPFLRMLWPGFQDFGEDFLFKR